MSTERFEKLMYDFQDAEAEFGEYAFRLYARPLDDYRNPIGEWIEIGTIPTGFHTYWFISAPATGLGSSRRLDDCADRFKSLAKRGGAMLPTATRKQCTEKLEKLTDRFGVPFHAAERK